MLFYQEARHYECREVAPDSTKNTLENRRNWMLWMFEKAAKSNKRNKKFQFWRQDNHPIELLPHQDSFASQKLEYIHNNPVEAMIVEKAEEYIFSSARDYAGVQGLIKVQIYQ